MTILLEATAAAAAVEISCNFFLHRTVQTRAAFTIQSAAAAAAATEVEEESF